MDPGSVVVTVLPGRVVTSVVLYVLTNVLVAVTVDPGAVETAVVVTNAVVS